MEIIGITGLSGTGKTTIAEKLSEILPNAKCETGDKWMFKIESEFRELARATWGDEILESKEKTLLEYIFEQGEQGIEFIRKTLPWINQKILEEMKKYEEQGKEYFIIEWALLPVLDIWENLDCRFYVNSDNEKRHSMLLKRTKGYCDEKKAQIRDEFAAFAFEEIGENVIQLTNDFTEESMQEILTIIAENISGLVIQQKNKYSREEKK